MIKQLMYYTQKGHFILGYYLLALIGLFFGAIHLLYSSKLDATYFINSFGNLYLDLFFNAITQLGLGITMAILALYYLLFRIYTSLLLAGGLVISGLVTFFCKQVLFIKAPRPIREVDFDQLTHLVQGVHFHQWGSYPSGHTLTAFFTATILAITLRNKKISLGLIVLASLVGLSRIYLLQHFFIDVYTGAILGILLATGLHFSLKRYQAKFNGNILSRIKQSNVLSANMFTKR